MLNDLGTRAQEVPPAVGAGRGQRGEEDVDLAEEDVLADPEQGLVPQAHSGGWINRERNQTASHHKILHCSTVCIQYRKSSYTHCRLYSAWLVILSHSQHTEGRRPTSEWCH